MLASALLLLGTTGCKNDLDRVAAIDVAAQGPDRTTYNAEYYFSDSGLVRNRLRAGVIDEYQADPPRIELSEGLELRFFDVQGREGSRLTARRGTILNGQRRMLVEGEVVFTNAKGERLETEQLIWAQDSARVWTDRPVRVLRDRVIIHGNGLDAAEDFSRYTVRRITGTIVVDPRDTLAPAQR
ncbi:MAG TPA: LPS export ABC transporter periplasmic protein LptC [Flavobacteriales bacterium]